MANQAMQDFARMPNQRKALVFGVVIMLSAALYYQFVFKGLRDDVEQAEGDHDNKVLQNDKLAKDLPAYDKLKTKFTELQKIVTENQKALPTESEMPAFFETLNRKVKDSGVEIRSWTQAKEEPVETFAKVPVKLEITGTFLQIKRFFASLVQKKDDPRTPANPDEPKERERIVTIEGLALGDPKLRNREIILTARFVATTYRQDEVKDAATAAGAPVPPMPPAGSTAPPMPSAGKPPMPTPTPTPTPTPPTPSTATPAGAKAKTEEAIKKGDAVDRNAAGVDEAKTPAGSARLKGGI
ncbi:MAG: type 4a pilus biogenesis protein PilO [Proteobacteria bacterium]|nr:type 4a pilus biogenesis protein PilO [Pseudomonadota bacterium]